MSLCYEVAIFKVEKKHMPRVMALSLLLLYEINQAGIVISSYDIIQNTESDDQLCWQLTWVNQDAVKATAKKWASFPSSQEIESLVGEKIYYGHFLSLL